MDHTPARWWKTENEQRVLCTLCPRKCLIAPDKRGYCGVRKNMGGALYSLVYGYPAAMQIDPIEKKPLCHFLPGTKAFSIGTLGCNLGCLFCQNDSLSDYGPREEIQQRFVTPEEIVELALKHNCRSIAYTYNEPAVFAEYAVDTARLAREAGLKNVFVTNGFITPEAAKEIYPFLDAANFDMKGFSENFYADLCKGSLAPVLESIRLFHALGKHLEVTNLVIPGQNDSQDSIGRWLDWAEENLGFSVPLHFSAYHPAFHFRSAPPTPPALLRQIGALAQKRGFKHVHLGNI